MKSTYETPSMELTAFSPTDIITTSLIWGGYNNTEPTLDWGDFWGPEQ